MQSNLFLPVSRQDMKERNIDQLDFVYITGDAYVDHPSFGCAIISRVLESRGFTVGIIAQPDYKDENSINLLGEPRLGFLVSSGNMDSMVNHYYVSGKRREKDAYTPGGKVGVRPDRAVIVYCNLIRKTYKTKPIIIGGIEASLRRMAHYDYWSNSFRRSILLESGANIISYGMGEKSIVEIAEAMQSGIDISDITFIRGTVYKTKSYNDIVDVRILPTFDECSSDKELYAKSFMIQNQNTDPVSSKTLVEPYSSHCFIVQNPPQAPLTTMEMDDIYALPYTRTYHPMYESAGGIDALKEIKFSMTSVRGCFGACSFCALTFHQGRVIQSRSHESLIQEAELMTKDKDFKGYIHDVGGPTANFRHPSCAKQEMKGCCKDRQCLFPKPCPNLTADHKDYVALLRKLRQIPKVKKVFIRSGIRFDYLMQDKDETFLKELVENHISGQLKVAPEHVSPNVLQKMGKPDISVFKEFVKRYEDMNVKCGKDQFLVPYFMSSHPGSTLKDAIVLAEYIRDMKYHPEQVQDFYPTPSTISTVMYYTGIDPRTQTPVYVVRSPHEKAMQRALMQYFDPKNYDLVKEALITADRRDLIGFEPHCLIKPRQLSKDKRVQNKKGNHQDRKGNKKHESKKR